MKSSFAILFSILFLLTSMQQTTVYILYKLNQKSITEKYCINKKVKNSCCKGSCHLKDTLNKIDKEDSKNPTSTFNLKVKEIELILYKIPNIQYAQLSENYNQFFTTEISNLSIGIKSTLLKPPCFLG